jgi:predicted dehydrogenase
MSTKVRWGVVGSGGIARRRTIPEGIAAASNAELLAVYDVAQAANEEVARKFGATPVGSIRQLLESEADSVYVATPACLHYAQVLECLAAGKHVFCEKPLGMNVAQAEEMLATAAKLGLRLGTAFMMRFHSQHQAALEIIRRGGLGKPAYARAQLSCWYPPLEGAWRQNLAQGGGGSLIDMGGHVIDLLEMFFGPVERVSCFTRDIVHNYEPEDSAVAMLWFECGALGTVDTFFCIPDRGSDNVLELYGSLGSIVAKGTIGQGSQGRMTARLEQQVGGYEAEQQRGTGEGIEISPEPVNPYRAEIEDFSEAILSGREPGASGEAGLRSQKVLAACYESARAGRAVEVENLVVQGTTLRGAADKGHL